MKAISKRYGKQKWIDTPFSKHYKESMAAHRIMSHIEHASLAAMATAQICTIRNSQGDPVLKAASIGANAVRAMTAVTKLAKQSNIKTNEIKTKWGVK